MPFNGSGTFSVYTPGNPVVTGTTISSTVANATNSDFATGLSNCVAKDGQSTPTANLPMGGFKLTGLAVGSAATDSVRYDQALLVTGTNMTGGINDAKTTVASATTPTIFATTIANTIDYTGTVTCTGFATAPQAGAKRTLICAGAAVFTAGANMLINGVASGSNYTAQAGDRIDVVAFTTSQFYLSPQPIIGLPTGFKIGSFTRDTSLASGSQAVTGVGFKPRLLVFLSGSASGAVGATSIGFDTVTNNGVLYHTNNADSWATQASASIIAIEGAGVSYSGTLSSMDSDGFTMGWTKTGATGGTLTIPYLAIR